MTIPPWARFVTCPGCATYYLVATASPPLLPLLVAGVRGLMPHAEEDVDGYCCAKCWPALREEYLAICRRLRLVRLSRSIVNLQSEFKFRLRDRPTDDPQPAIRLVPHLVGSPHEVCVGALDADTRDGLAFADTVATADTEEAMWRIYRALGKQWVTNNFLYGHGPSWRVHSNDYDDEEEDLNDQY